MKTEILYGVHPVTEAVRAGKRDIFEIYVSKDLSSKRFDKIKKYVFALNINVLKVKPERLEDMTGGRRHQGICARTGAYHYTGFSEMLDCKKELGQNRFFLLLDNILDPNNFGAIVRSALCVGVDGIIIPKDRSVSSTPAVSKASAGALEHARVAIVTNLANTVKILKKNGVWIYGMDMTAEKTIYSTDFGVDMAIIIGGEEKGIRPLSKKLCDLLISIPQVAGIDSLNASVAGAVVMYEAFRQRHYNKSNSFV